MLARPASGKPEAGLEHHGNFDLAAGHIAKSRSFVDDLIERYEHEFAHVQLDNGAEASQGGADGNAELRGLGNRSDAHPALAESLEERIAVGHGHVLAV